MYYEMFRIDHHNYVGSTEALKMTLVPFHEVMYINSISDLITLADYAFNRGVHHYKEQLAFLVLTVT